MVYDIKNLIYYCSSPYTRPHTTINQVICDIDKTYLETQTSSFLDLAKTAWEKPEDKKTIFGAKEYLNALLWNTPKKQNSLDDSHRFPQNLHFVSASPPQLRHRLEEKFLMDRLYWTSITLKNQFYNIKKIKFKLLREQISYKTLAIFNIIDKNPSSTFFLIGDDSESDPYIYSGIKLFKDGLLSHRGYLEFLKIAQLTRESIKTIAQTKGFLKPAKIKGIFIRETKPKIATSLDPYITTFQSYKNLFLYSYKKGYLTNSVLKLFLKKFYASSSSENPEQINQESLFKDLRNSHYSEDESLAFLKKLLLGKELQTEFAQPPKTAPISESIILENAREWFDTKSTLIKP